MAPYVHAAALSAILSPVGAAAAALSIADSAVMLSSAPMLYSAAVSNAAAFLLQSCRQLSPRATLSTDFVLAWLGTLSSARLGSARLPWIGTAAGKSTWALGSVELREAPSFSLASAHLSSARIGSARLGSARLGSARLGSARAT